MNTGCGNQHLVSFGLHVLLKERSDLRTSAVRQKNDNYSFNLRKNIIDYSL